MPAGGEPYGVTCLMCGTEVGQIASGRFIKHASCTTSLPRRAACRSANQRDDADGGQLGPRGVKRWADTSAHLRQAGQEVWS
jgi:hypothetical protein